MNFLTAGGHLWFQSPDFVSVRKKSLLHKAVFGQELGGAGPHLYSFFLYLAWLSDMWSGTVKSVL